MQIKTDGKLEYRLDQLRRVMQATDEEPNQEPLISRPNSRFGCWRTSIRLSIIPI